MSGSPGSDLGSTRGPGPAAPGVTGSASGGQALGITAFAIAGLALAIVVVGPYLAAAFGYNAPMYELLGTLMVGMFVLSLVAIALGIVAMRIRRGASFGLAALLLGGIFAVWAVASFAIPLLFGPLG
jgi:hypothetical protein